LFTPNGQLGKGNVNSNVRSNRFKNKNSVISIEDPENVE